MGVGGKQVAGAWALLGRHLLIGEVEKLLWEYTASVL